MLVFVEDIQDCNLKFREELTTIALNFDCPYPSHGLYLSIALFHLCFLHYYPTQSRALCCKLREPTGSSFTKSSQAMVEGVMSKVDFDAAANDAAAPSSVSLQPSTQPERGVYPLVRKCSNLSGFQRTLLILRGMLADTYSVMLLWPQSHTHNMYMQPSPGYDWIWWWSLDDS